jgi:hypothetical protein
VQDPEKIERKKKTTAATTAPTGRSLSAFEREDRNVRALGPATRTIARASAQAEGQLRQSEGDIGGSTAPGEQNPGPREIGDDEEEEEEVPTRRSGRQGKGTWSDKGLAFRGRQ